MQKRGRMARTRYMGGEGHWYGLNVPPPFICWNVMVLGSGALGWCLGHKDGTLMNGISSLLKDTLQSFLALSTIPGYNKNLPALKRAVTRIQPCWYPYLRLPASRTVRK